MRPNWILALFAVSAAVAQGTPPPVPAKPADAAKVAKQDPLAALRKAGESERDAALVRYIDAQIATQAVYAGQYSALRKLDWDVTPSLRGWMAKAPSTAKAAALSFREACVNALRDCVDEASEELVAELKAVAKDGPADSGLVAKAKYALAQFGHTEFVDAMIADATKRTESAGVEAKYRAWSELADIYYNIRTYEKAANAHREVIQLVEQVNPNFQGLPINYYNCACSYALLGKKEAALEHIGKALKIGKRLRRQLGIELLKTDMDIRSLRSEPKFAELMKEYFGIEPAKAAPKPPAPGKDAGKR